MSIFFTAAGSRRVAVCCLGGGGKREMPWFAGLLHAYPNQDMAANMSGMLARLTYYELSKGKAMDDFSKSVYVGEIKKQCEFSLAAIRLLNFALQQLHSRELEQGQLHFFHSEVFRQIHSFLTHASNVSRMFWPATPKRRQNESDADYENRLLGIDKVIRARSLKAEYNLNDSNPLKDRTLRDHLEHYDERIDHWRNTSVNRNIASDTIGPPNTIAGLADSDMMRWYDPTRNIFKFRGEEFDIQAIATEIDQLLPQSAQLEQNLWNRRTGR